MSGPLIDCDRVTVILRDCLFTEEELPGEVPSLENVPDGAVTSEGIMNHFAFHAGRLEAHRDEVREMLRALPDVFKPVDAGGGGGGSFLLACEDRSGAQWTGLHKQVDALLSLGQALGYVTCLLPRAMWSALPGGMPYYAVTVT